MGVWERASTRRAGSLVGHLALMDPDMPPSSSSQTELPHPNRSGGAKTSSSGATWFLRGLAAALGVAVVVALAWLVIQAIGELVLIGLAFFIAVGLDPAVQWLHRHRLPRWAAVTVVVVVGLGTVAGFLATAIPVAVSQATQFATALPQYLQSAAGRDSVIGRVDARFHLQQVVEHALTGDNGATVLGAGEAVFTGVTSTVIVIALVVYFLADLPRLQRTLYRLVPRSRRPRAVVLGDQIFAKVGGYVLGSLVLATIAGVSTLIWLLIIGVSYAVLLAILVALLDLIPVLGSIIGGVAVTVVVFTVSTPSAIATILFFVAYRLVEDYVLLPRIIGRTVNVPALVTLVAVVLGASLLGPIGAIVAIPVAAAGLLLLREVVIPRIDHS